MLRIAITDDHTLFRKSLGLLLNSFHDIQVCIEASDGTKLLQKLPATEADIILLDLQMPEMDGYTTANKIKELYPHIKILVLTHMNETDTIRKVVKLGVHGFFTKNTPPKELEDAIWKLKDNGFYFEKSLTSVVDEILNTKDISGLAENKGIAFTNRELEIIILVAQGLKAKEIAETLFISTKTVNSHKQNIQQKYGFDNLMSAILYCVHNNIIDLDQITIKK
ncbi:response regulator transcription factor [Elizabethkingia anophelis]|jgi:DNA-binding NarL/FixJ family response regulator|nr:response regulator transcription factor [Elizabethkingia anophelis]